MPRKKIAVVLSVIIALLALGGIITIITANKETGIKKYEWIKRLSQRFNVVEYQNKTPYFQDVTAENEYFEYIQAACEYGIVDEGKLFRGDEVATGEYVALTAMKAIGKYKVQIYMGLEHLPDEKEYLQLAVEKELIPESKLKEGITEEQADDIVKFFQHIICTSSYNNTGLCLSKLSDHLCLIVKQVVIGYELAAFRWNDLPPICPFYDSEKRGFF